MDSGILAVDFGGTRIRAAWFNMDIQQQHRQETLSRVADGPEVVVNRIVELARSIVPEGGQVQAIGISAPGPMDAERGVIQHALTLPGWEEVPLAPILSETFGGVAAYMQNDANLAALAEYDRGGAAGSDPLIYLTLSTGIGGGAVIGGHLFTGWRGLAIEPGHQRFRLPDGTLKRLEDLASGTALGHIANKRITTSTLDSTLRNLPTIDGKAVGAAALSGDVLAQQIVGEAGTWLGLGLINIIHLFNPQAIVLGGSVAGLGDLLLEPARQVIRSNVLDPGFDDLSLLQVTKLGDDVCLIGAALYARSRHRLSPASFFNPELD